MFSTESLACTTSFQSSLLRSSRDLDWTSLLLDQMSLSACFEPYETASTPDQTISLMFRGTLTLESWQGRSWRRSLYSPGTIGLTPSHGMYRLRRSPPLREGSAEVLKLYVPQLLFDEAFEEFRKPGQPSTMASLNTLSFEDPSIASMLLSLWRAMREGAPSLYADSAARWLAAHLLLTRSSHVLPSARTRDGGSIEDKRLRRVLEYIQHRYAEQLSLQKLAREAGISKHHFARLFTRATGYAPHAYLIRTRLDASRKLLRTTDHDILHIAAACGYERAAHFAAAFSSRFGITPTAYRRGVDPCNEKPA